MRHVRVQALDGEQVAHAADAGAERRAAVDHGSSWCAHQVGAADGGVGGGVRRRARQLRLGRDPRASTRHAAAALQAGDGGDQRGAGAVVQRRERPAEAVVGQVLDDRGEPEGQRAATALIAWGARPSWPATTAASAPATREASLTGASARRRGHGRLSGAACATGPRRGRGRRWRPRPAAWPC